MTVKHTSLKRTIFRISALVLFALSIAAAVIPISSLRIDNRLEIWFVENDPNRLYYDRGHQLFGDWDWISIYVSPLQGVYQEEFLQNLKAVTSRLEALPEVKKVISIANARGNRLDQDELSYEPILPKPPWQQYQLQALRDTLDTNLIYRNGLIKPGLDKSTLIMVQVWNKEGKSDAYRITLVDNINSILGEYSSSMQNHALVGTPYLNAELNRSSRHDMYLFYPLVTLLVTVIAWFVFRNVRDVVATLATLTGVTAWSVGLMMLDYQLNMVTIMMPTVLVTVSVANIMHMIVSFHLVREAHPEWGAERSAKAVMKDLWVPSLGTTTTTAVGFLSLTQAGIVPIDLLGYFSALGIMFAFFLTFTLLPLLLVSLWDDNSIELAKTAKSRSLVHRVSWASIISKTSLAHPYWVLLIFILASVAVSGRIPWLQADTNYVDLFEKSTYVKNHYDTIEKVGYATNSLTLLVHAPTGLQDPAVFRAQQELERKIEALPETRNVLSPLKLIAEVDRAMAEDKSQWTPSVPNYGRDAFAQLMLTAEISGNDDLRDLLSPDHKDFQVTLFTDYLSSDETHDYAGRLETLAKQILPQGTVAEVTGTALLWSNMDNHLLVSQSNIMISVVLPLAVIMLIIVRSIPLLVIGLVVNLLPVAFILGLMAWMDVKINMATVLIGGITMGIAVDDTIHFLWHYRSEVKQGKSFRDALSSTYQHTGTAILMTALLLSCGFLIMALSNFKPTADFGKLTSFTIIIAFITEIFLMPTLLCLLEGAKRRLAAGKAWWFRKFSDKSKLPDESYRND